ncbi:TPA: transposase [Klebsiella aerogenes]|nr:transposase [Klebsiella aerogenes]HCB3719479.1 transposase [Klebsiella aerogenes]HCM1706970.1 transposase [Klebsiella aerogenes]HDU2480718.1 transposase [Klebsiella aerogenes]
MKKSRFAEDQIVFALKQAELGTPVSEVCCKLGISDTTFIRGARHTVVFRPLS